MWSYPQFPADLVTFTGEILNGKLHFCAVCVWSFLLSGIKGLKHTSGKSLECLERILRF